MGSLAGNPTAGDFVGQRNHPMGDPEMRKLYLMLPVGFVLALSACQTPEQTTMAGAAAIAKPPTPAVSVMAESPRSAAASATE